MVLEQLDCQEAQAIETSQLETNALLGSISKRCITTLIIFQKNMNKRSKISLAWSKKSMKEEELMTLLEEMIVEVGKEAMGSFFLKNYQMSNFDFKMAKFGCFLGF